jgi:TRAP-type C4-dicarboxylate transport system permease large subunit
MIAALWAFFVTMFVYRDYKWKDLPRPIHRTAENAAMLI